MHDHVADFLNLLGKHQRALESQMSSPNDLQPDAWLVTSAAYDARMIACFCHEKTEGWDRFKITHPEVARATISLGNLMTQIYTNHKHKKVTDSSWTVAETPWVEGLRRELETLDRAISGSHGPSGWDRVRVHTETKTIVIDAHFYPVNDPATFSIVARLIHAKGDLVTKAELEQLPGCKGRIGSKLVKHAPALKKNFILSKRGNGGGYWFALPAEIREGAQ